MPNLSQLLSHLKIHDNDRYLQCLFAPASHRPALITLFSFNYEIARIREHVSDPMVGMIRLQWWRESLECAYNQESRNHDVVDALSMLLKQYTLPKDILESLINIREKELDTLPFQQYEELEDFISHSSGKLNILASNILGVNDPNTTHCLHHSSCAWSLMGIARSFKSYLAKQHCKIPAHWLETYNINLDHIQPNTIDKSFIPIIQLLTEKATLHLDKANQLLDSCNKNALPLLLQIPIAEHYCNITKKNKYSIHSHLYKRSRFFLLLQLFWKARRLSHSLKTI